MEITDYEVLVGTYEEFLLGYKIEKKLKCEDKYEFVPSFTQRAHIGPVRSVVGINKFIVSGGSDEMCKIYNLATRVEHGQLMHHQGTVSCLAAFEKTYLFTGSDDNSLAVINVGSWQVEKTLYKHQAGITAVAVHPSGKLAFSAGKDKKLITWNLVKARPAFISNIKGIAEFLAVSPDGCRYCVGIHRRIDVYSVDTAGIEYTIDLKCRPNGLAFLDSNIVAVGGESTKVQVHSLIEKCLIKEFEAHETRVRCLKSIPQTEENGHGKLLLTASSSDHLLKLWRIQTDKYSEVVCIASVDTTCRITCLTTWNPSMKGTAKRKKKKIPEETVGKPGKKLKFSEVTIEKTPTNEEVVVELEETSEQSQNKTKKNKKKNKKKSVEGSVTETDVT